VYRNITSLSRIVATPRGGAVKDVDLRPLACCDWGCESSRGYVCLSWVLRVAG